MTEKGINRQVSFRGWVPARVVRSATLIFISAVARAEIIVKDGARVAFLGDSITAGGTVATFSAADCYAHFL
jgi:hypothetical protein